MTIAEVFRPDGTATDMIDTLFDLLIGSGLPLGVAELQDGRQLFVLPTAPGIKVYESDVLYELSAYLADAGLTIPEMGREIKHATIDVNP